MLQANTIARPYSVALFKIAKESNSANIWQQTLRELSAVMQNEDIAKTVGNPKVNQAELVEDIKKSVSNQSKELDAFLQILLYNKRLLILPNISSYFDGLLNEYEGSSDVCIESALPITKKQQNEFVRYLEHKFGRKLNAKVLIVPELIGGMRAFVGDELFDYSIKAQLSNMKAEIMA